MTDADGARVVRGPRTRRRSRPSSPTPPPLPPPPPSALDPVAADPRRPSSPCRPPLPKVARAARYPLRLRPRPPPPLLVLEPVPFDSRRPSSPSRPPLHKVVRRACCSSRPRPPPPPPSPPSPPPSAPEPVPTDQCRPSTSTCPRQSPQVTRAARCPPRPRSRPRPPPPLPSEDEEMEHQQEPGDIRDESSLSNNPSTYPMNQESENLMASAPSKLLIGNEQTKRRARGPNQMPKHRYTITELMDNGIPCAPLSAAKAWKTACGCIVRDIVPINYRAWKGQRADGLVVKMEDKDLCWAKLREKFTFPPSTEEHARTASLSEMGRLFKSWKCELNKKFVQKGETPDFENPRFTKLKPFWDDFVAWKTSEEAQRISEQNKVNSLKNVEPHRLGPGGYLNKLSKWDQMEQRLIDSGVTPKTSTWTTRSKYYSYARGTVLSEDGNLVSRGPREHEMNQRIAEAHEKTSRGEFVPDRENDELTLALGNKEHPGRTRGVGLVPWRQGFPASAENYKSRRRDKGAETKNTRETITAEPQEVDRQMEARLQEQATQLLVQFQAQLQEHVQEALTQIQAGRASVPAPFRASPSGLRKSISASIEQPVRYPVDEITARTPCNLYMPWKNITKNVAQGVAHPCEAGQMLHGHVLPAGYARVEVKFVKPRHWDAKLDIPPKENIKTLGQALHCVIAWPKRYIDVDDEDLNDGEFAPPQR